MADWLQEYSIKIVAMESTGVYWIAAFEVLERRGFKGVLVNARHVKNVSGRKSDALDCQWIQRLHSYGLLNASFNKYRERLLRNLKKTAATFGFELTPTHHVAPSVS